MENFAQYFKPDRRIFLENINYETVSSPQQSQSRRLGCRDTVVAQLLAPAGVKIIFNRRLNFEPESMFTLSVSFGVFLAFDLSKFDPEKDDGVDWKSVNIVNEFTRSFPNILAELNARTTLLIAEITSAAGGAPLISVVPPKHVDNEETN